MSGILPGDVERGTPLEVLAAFLRLGCTSFGGPVAHIGYFRAAFVQRRGWLSEQSFADLFALCQFMPGPASSQLGMAIGLRRAGAPGMLCAWIGFTLPSALLMAAFGYGVTRLGDVADAPWLRGLKLVAVAVVAQAVWLMARNLCPDRARATLAVAAATIALAAWGPGGQVGAIVLGAVAGLLLLGAPTAPEPPRERLLTSHVPRALAIGLLLAFALLLVVLPVLGDIIGDHPLHMAAAFYRAGALVFGGGHVVLPLLQSAVVPPGWISNDVFLAGYGAAQAMPGPLFSFSAFLGASMRQPPNGWLGALLALVMIYLPSFLLVGGLLPFWEALRRYQRIQSVLRGINAAVVGILAAALYQAMWRPAVAGPIDFGFALIAFLLLAGWNVTPWIVVLLGAGVAQGLSSVGIPI